jgi:hypothetical protein
MRTHSIVVLALAAFSAVACTRSALDDDRGSGGSPPSSVKSTPNATGGGPSVASQGDAIARARCDYFAACGLVGAGKTYDDDAGCMRQQHVMLEKRWRRATCDRFEDVRVKECLEAMRESDTTSCSPTLPSSCSEQVLCKAPR